MINIMRTIEIDAGHRVLNHESKCSNPHGHRYKFEIWATAPELDSLGRVIDFSVLKAKVGSWIDDNWDHTMLVYEKDVDLIKALDLVAGTKAPFICCFNPTAENIGDYLLHWICPNLMEGTDVTVYKIVVHETPNCSAEITLEGGVHNAESSNTI